MSNRIAASHLTGRLTLADWAPYTRVRRQWWAGVRHLWRSIAPPRIEFALSEHMRRDMGYPVVVSQGAATPTIEARRLGF